jgi:uncharacterized protein
MGQIANIPGASEAACRAVAEVCRRHRVRVLRVFGSRAKNGGDEQSDLDVLVEFEQGVSPDLFEQGALQQDLSDAAGVEVDLKTPDMFSPKSLTRVMSGSVLGYAALTQEAWS